MPAKLTKAGQVSTEQQRISSLTHQHTAFFKIIFSHQISRRFRFSSIHNHLGQATTSEDKLTMLVSLGKFIDESTNLSITDVEDTYKRQQDTRDATFDPETKAKAEIQHFCIYAPSADINLVRDAVRIHGYYRNDYFIVTKLDWYHDVHSR